MYVLDNLRITDEYKDFLIWKLLMNDFNGYAEASELVAAYCSRYSRLNYDEGVHNAEAAIQRLSSKQWITSSEANAGKLFLKPTEDGILKMSEVKY